MTVTKEYTAAAIAIFDSLKSVPISQILRKSHRDLVAVFDTFSLIDFLDTLAAGNYLAAPVLHEAETGNVLMGVLSLTHVISYCFVHGAFAATLEGNNEFDELDLQARLEDILSVPIGEIAKEQLKGPPEILKPDGNVAGLLELMTKGREHRILVVEPSVFVNTPAGQVPIAECIRIITQHDVAQFLLDCSEGEDKLASNLSLILGLPVRSVAGFSQEYRPTSRVIAMNDFQPILAGLNVIYLNNLHAVPVLDDKDRLVASLSESVLYGWTQKNLEMIARPISTVKADFVIATSGDRLETIYKQMLQKSLNHAWVIGDKHLVDSSITWSDILLLFVPFSPREA